MLRSLYVLALITQVLAQRGGDYGGYGGYRGDYQETPLAQIVTQTQVQTQIQTHVQTRTQTQVQVQTKVMVSTALSMAPTTIVQVQATTVVKVATIPSSPLASTTLVQSPILDPSSPPSMAGTADQSPTPFIDSISISEGLTVDANPSPSPSPSTPGPSDLESGSGDASPTATRAIGAASEVSAPMTRLTGTVPGLSDMEYRTTGVPHLDDAAQGVIYGHVSRFSLSFKSR